MFSVATKTRPLFNLLRGRPVLAVFEACLRCSLTLITNGTRLTPALVARLARISVNVSVSLDTLDRRRYRRIRGADQLPQVLTGLELLSAGSLAACDAGRYSIAIDASGNVSPCRRLDHRATFFPGSYCPDGREAE
jgi:MoaA/NifB/PqqE/SkfB family radical SAM enzyme